MPTQAKLLRILQQHRLANHATIRDNTSCDKSYTSEYKNFVTWVKAQPELITPEAPFLTHNNVDNYNFTHVISTKPTGKNTNTMHRVINALNWSSNHHDHIVAYPQFKCESPLD
jgi:hypothetical protein